MAQLLQRLFFFSEILLQLEEYGTVDSSTVDNQKIITPLVPAVPLQSGESKTLNKYSRGTMLYANYIH